MAREQRKNVDYFPHECVHGRKMHIIENKYGNDGYATWFKILEQLGRATNHFVHIEDESVLMYLASICKIDEEKLKSILTDLSKIGAIDQDLYLNHNVIFSQKFVDSVADAYRKRKTEIPSIRAVLEQISSKNDSIRAGNPSIRVNKAEVIRKEKNSIEKKRKEDDDERDFSGEKPIVDNIDFSINQKHSDFLKKSDENQQWREAVCMQQKITPDQLSKKIDEFELHLRTKQKIHKNMREFIDHLTAWIPKNSIREKPKQPFKAQTQGFKPNSNFAKN